MKRVQTSSLDGRAFWAHLQGRCRLEQRGLFRHEHYMIDIIGDQACQASIQGLATWAEVTDQGAGLFGGDIPVGARLRATSERLQHVRQDMIEAAEQWPPT